MPLEKIGHPSFKVLPGKIDSPGAWEMIERSGLDAVNELSRFALGGNHVKETARSRRFTVKIQNPPRQQVVPSEIVEEPGVEAE
jgi:hypothetical protein